MKNKKSLIITALILFAINWFATTLLGFASIFTMSRQMSLMSLNFLWTVFNALVGMIVALLLVIAAICAFKEKGHLLAASAFILCAVQNFLSFVPNLTSIDSIGHLLAVVALDWLCAAAYALIAVAALTKWKTKTPGVVGSAIVLCIRVFAMINSVRYFMQRAIPFSQILPSILLNFLFCILMLNVGIVLYVLAQKKAA